MTEATEFFNLPESKTISYIVEFDGAGKLISLKNTADQKLLDFKTAKGVTK